MVCQIWHSTCIYIVNGGRVTAQDSKRNRQLERNTDILKYGLTDF